MSHENTPFPDDMKAWEREFYVGTPEEYEVIAISVSEPWREREHVWNCAVRILHPGGHNEVWASGYDALDALGYALGVVGLRQRAFLVEHQEKLLWPPTMTPILGSSLEDTIIEWGHPLAQRHF
ncbi:MAG: DUF6968 family protein [Fimbriimonadaceae bacterium]